MRGRTLGWLRAVLDRGRIKRGGKHPAQQPVSTHCGAAKSQEEAARWQGRAQALQEALGEVRQQVAWLSERAGVPKDGDQPRPQEDRI